MTVREHIPLAPYTTFNIGGPAEFFVVVHTEDDVQEACEYARDRSLPVTVLGGGSNVLVSDEGVSGIVIKNEIRGVAFNTNGAETDVTVGGGVSWDGVVAESVARGLWGLENLSGIPGTVGGAIVQNINAYGVTIEEFVEEVYTIHTPTGTQRVFTSQECQFSYRDSFFKTAGEGKEYIVTSMRLRLTTTPRMRTEYKSASQSMAQYFMAQGITNPTSGEVRAAVLSVRARIGMVAGMYQSAGSFFTNVILKREDFVQLETTIQRNYADMSETHSPWHWTLSNGGEKVSTAFLMECTEFNKTTYGEKTWRGDVGISPLHTLSIVNVDNACAEDIRAFADTITQTIWETFGVKLSSEICFL